MSLLLPESVINEFRKEKMKQLTVLTIIIQSLTFTSGLLQIFNKTEAEYSRHCTGNDVLMMIQLSGCHKVICSAETLIIERSGLFYGLS